MVRTTDRRAVGCRADKYIDLDISIERIHVTAKHKETLKLRIIQNCFY